MFLSQSSEGSWSTVGFGNPGESRLKIIMALKSQFSNYWLYFPGYTLRWIWIFRLRHALIEICCQLSANGSEDNKETKEPKSTCGVFSFLVTQGSRLCAAYAYACSSLDYHGVTYVSDTYDLKISCTQVSDIRFWHMFTRWARLALGGLNPCNPQCQILSLNSCRYSVLARPALSTNLNMCSMCVYTWKLWHHKCKYCVISSFLFQASCKAIRKLVSPELTQISSNLETGVSCRGLHGFSFNNG